MDAANATGSSKRRTAKISSTSVGFQLFHQQPAIRQAFDPALRDQQRQRLPDRLPADPEPVRQLLLADRAAGAQRAAFDSAFDSFDDRLR